MKTCPACREKIQDGARICPYCRTEQPNYTMVWVWGFVILMIIGWIDGL